MFIFLCKFGQTLCSLTLTISYMRSKKKRREYIETTNQLSKEVGEDNPRLNVFNYSVQVTGKRQQDDKPKVL